MMSWKKQTEKEIETEKEEEYKTNSDKSHHIY